MDLLFAWDDWNREHIGRHGVAIEEAEFVVRRARIPWPEDKGEGKSVVWGETERGALLQVIFVFKRPFELGFDALSAVVWAEIGDADDVIYVIHAMPLTDRMKRQYRRRVK